MSVKGDFLGFKYANILSSDLGIIRTSDGSRFNESLLPTQTNRTVHIPGRDETYFFGSNSTQKQFNISFVFDSLTQTQLQCLREVFGGKEIAPLELDEYPEGVIWQAKVTACSIKYIPFDEYIENEDGEPSLETIYKGEGTIQFTCYEPYGILTKEPNSSIESGITTYTLQNDGVAPADWILKTIGFPSTILIGDYELKFDANRAEQYSNDFGLIFNSKNGLICGLDSDGNKTNNLYNRFITSGNLKKIPLGEAIVFSCEGGQVESFVYKCLYN